MSKQEPENLTFAELELSEKTLSRITGVPLNSVEGLATAREHNIELTKSFNYLVTEFGYADFYDLSVATLAKSQEIAFKGGGKDFGNLTAVEQTVVRNGKPIKMKIYVDKNKKQDEDGDNNELDKGSGAVRASELSRGYRFGDMKAKADPKTTATLSDEIAGWEDAGGFTGNSYDYLEGRDENGVLRYLVGFSIQGEYVVTDFMLSDGTVGGYWTSTFYELMKKGYENHLGGKYPNLNTRALYLLAQEYSFTLEGEYLVIDKETLNDVFKNT